MEGHRSKIIYYFIFPLLVAIVSIILTWWFSDVYSRPKIEYYSRPYFKVDDFSVGNVFLINEGKRTDKNIAITFFEEINDNDLKIVDLVSGYSIRHNDNKTTIVIDELKPQESADISFKVDGSKDDSFMNIISDSSNIYNMFEEPWYHFSLPILFIFILISFIIGGLICFNYFYRRNINRIIS